MRLIDADKLTKDLIENKSFYPAIVKRAIEEAPTVQVMGEWISVEERLPEKNVLVLVYYECMRMRVDFITFYGNWFEEAFFGKPTHWMPLPQPPQMKGN